jgi:peroxiredoxin
MFKKNFLAFIIFSCLIISCKNEKQVNPINENDKKMDIKKEERTTLGAKLEEKKSDFTLKANENTKRAYQEGIEAVVKSGIASSAKQFGDEAPDFTLNNALGQPVSLSEYLKEGKVVLTWYRGGWCPYCNLTLRALQEELSNFKENGANLIALTPELPDNSMSTKDKYDLEFEVLSDVGNQVAEKYGIVFQLTDEVAEMYNQAFELNNHNGDQSNKLPLAATYVINENGEIIYAFLDADYRNRAEPSEITEFLKKT